jgi:glycine/D-amino acid oxidase-like deaminating enzyme
MVRAIPLVAADIEAAAEITRHRGEAAVGSGDRHVWELRPPGENDVHAVIVVVCAAHQVIAFAEQEGAILVEHLKRLKI